MDLTVAICTYRRFDLLQTTLRSLSACQRLDIAWELLLIDNGCDGRIEALASRFTDRLPVRYIAEPRLGASFARNRATREAAAPVVLFTDDDVTFDPAWLVNMWRAIIARPDCAFWGGRVEPVWDRPRPAHFRPELCPTLADAIVQYDRGPASRYWDAASDPPFYTANLALRTGVIAAAGYFDTTVGHRGDRRMGMEDSLMVKAIAAAGGRGWYAADAFVHHPVPHERVTPVYLRHFALRQAWLSTRMHRTGPGHSVPTWFYRTAVESCARGLGRWCRGRLDGDEGAAFAGQFSALYAAGRLYYALVRA